MQNTDPQVVEKFLGILVPAGDSKMSIATILANQLIVFASVPQKNKHVHMFFLCLQAHFSE